LRRSRTLWGTLESFRGFNKIVQAHPRSNQKNHQRIFKGNCKRENQNRKTEFTKTLPLLFQ
jgi:hypothetical protein